MSDANMSGVIEHAGKTIERWLTWDAEQRYGKQTDNDHVVLDGFTNAPPVWPTRGCLKAWLEALGRLAIIERQNAQLRLDLERKQRAYADLARMHENLLIMMQAAWIEFRHGNGAEHAMDWIGNALDGPGLIPDFSETNAQAFYDKHKVDAVPAEGNR